MSDNNKNGSKPILQPEHIQVSGTGNLGNVPHNEGGTILHREPRSLSNHKDTATTWSRSLDSIPTPKRAPVKRRSSAIPIVSGATGNIPVGSGVRAPGPKLSPRKHNVSIGSCSTPRILSTSELSVVVEALNDKDKTTKTIEKEVGDPHKNTKTIKNSKKITKTTEKEVTSPHKNTKTIKNSVQEEIDEDNSKTFSEQNDVVTNHLAAVKPIDEETYQLVINTMENLTKKLVNYKSREDLVKDVNTLSSSTLLVDSPFTSEQIEKSRSWRKICNKMISIRNIEIGLLNADIERRNKLAALSAANSSLVDAIDKYEGIFVAQSNVSPKYPMKRARISSDDMNFKYLIDGSDPPPVESTEAFDEACEILMEINDKCNMLRVLSKRIKESDEKAHIRRTMYDFYLRINRFLMIEQVAEDFRILYRDWRNEAPVGEMYIDQEFPPDFYEQSSDNNRPTHAQCLNSMCDSPTAEPTSSFRLAARDTDIIEDDSAKLHEIFHAQSFFKVGLDEPTSHKVDSIIDEISSLNRDGIKLNVDVLTSFKEKISGFFSEKGTLIKSVAFGLTMAFCAYKAYSTREHTWKVLAGLVSMFSACFISRADLLAKIQEMYSWCTAPEGTIDVDAVIYDEDELEDEFHAQSFKENVSSTVLSFVYLNTFLGAKSSKNPVTSFLKTAGDVPKWKNGLNDFIDFVTSLVQRFLNWMAIQFDSEPYIIADLPYPDAYSFARDVDKMVAKFNGGLSYNYDNGQAFYALLTRGKQLYTRLPASSADGRAAREMISLALADLHPIQKKFARANINNNGPRVPPIGVLIGGPSGIGKTDLAQFLMNEVTAKVIPADQLEAFRKNHNDTTYTRNSENGYWEGYHGQFNTYTDDIGQTVDVAGQPDNEYMEHVRMLGPGNFPLNMANLEDKGNVNFRSSIVWATTNRSYFKLNSMYYNEPFCRRFAIAYVMTPKKEYCTHASLSTDNIWDRRISHFPASRSDRSYIEFWKWNFETGKLVSGLPISYDELVSNIVDTYNINNGKGSHMMELHQAEKVRIIDDRLARENAIKIMSEEKLEPQAGGDAESSSESIFYDIDNESIKISAKTIKTMPESMKPHIENQDGIILVNTLALKSDTSQEFVRNYLHNTGPESVSWHVLIAKIINKAEEVQNQPATSHDSLATEVCRKYMDSCKPVLDATVKKLLEYKGYIASTIAALVGLRYIWSWFTTLAPDAQSVGGMRHKERSTAKPISYRKGGDKFSSFALKPGKGKHNRGHMQLRGHKLESQAGADGNGVDILRKCVRNQYSIALPDAVNPLGKITFVVPYTGICPLHFGERLQYGVDEGEYDDDSCITLWSVLAPQAKIYIPISQIKIIASEEGTKNDWCLIRIPEVINRTPNLLKFWAEDTTFADRGQFDAMLNVVRGDEMFIQAFTAVPRKTVAEYEDYCITNGYQYHYDTKIGDCGSLLAQANKAVSCGKLIGIHTAGTGSIGFAPRITRDQIKHALTGFDEDYDKTIEKDLMDDIMDLSLDGDEVEGFESQCYGRPVPRVGKTNIARTPLHNTYSKSIMAPAILHPVIRNGERVDPMAKTRAKYSIPTKSMDPHLLKLTSQYVLSRMTKVSEFGAPWVNPKIFTFEEAVAGIPDVEFVEGIPRNTSAGYPYKLDVPNGHKGKTHFFGEKDDYEFTSHHCKELKIRVEKILQDAKNGIRNVHVFLDFLKDERRPFNKIENVSTRMISACPLDLLIAFRMYFLDFMRWIMYNRISNGSAVGVNCYSSEWELLAKELESMISQKGGGVVAGDYSHYDGSTTRQLQRAVLSIINQWYNDEHSRVREVLWEEICSSRHIFDYIIYMWNGSTPSGSPPTTILNTINNMLLIVYTFILAYIKENSDEDATDNEKLLLVHAAFRIADENLRFTCFGDDNVITVSAMISAYYNQHTITQHMSDIGYVYQTEAKDGVLVEETRSMNEISYLKRKFTHSALAGRRICPLDLSVILEMPQWTTKKDTSFVDARTNVDTALRELSLHSEAVFDKFSKKILGAAMEKLGYTPQVTDYKVLQLATLSSLEYL